LEKKRQKSLSVPKKALPLHPQSREMAERCGIFEQAESKINLLFVEASPKISNLEEMRK